MTSSVQVMSLVEEYLAARRAAGFALLHEEGQFRAFARFTEPSYDAPLGRLTLRIDID